MKSFAFSDLIAWSERLPEWQRDALRRVLSRPITDDDIVELTALARGEKPLRAGQSVSPEPATDSHVRADHSSAPPVAVVEIRDISRVNALGPGPLQFEPSGLTLIYGDNGSGKSGIARVLKKACRARDQGGPIRPDIREPPQVGDASATFVVRVGGVDQDIPWKEGSVSDPVCSRVNVFDAACAVAQVEQPNRLLYTPPILQAFEDLAQVCRRVAAKLRAERDLLASSKNPATLAALKLREGTKAYQLRALLSKDTDSADIEQLCLISDDDSSRVEDLRRVVRQDDQTARTGVLSSRIRRLRELDAVADSVEAKLGSEPVEQALQALGTMADLQVAVEASRADFASRAVIEGLGTNAWRALWEAAREYSQKAAYPTESFPVIQDGSRCVLCHQILDPTASERLAGFERFIQEDVQRRFDDARRRVAEHASRLRAFRVPLSGPILRESGVAGTPLAIEAKRYIVVAKLRRKELLQQLTSSGSNTEPELPARPSFITLLEELEKEKQLLDATAIPQQRERLVRDLAELEDRITVSTVKSILLDEIDRLAQLAALEAVLSLCDTTGLTRKRGEVAEIVITGRLRSAFSQNLRRLAFPSAPAVDMRRGAGTAGQHPYQLTLVARADVPPDEVLSEGERTCVALAGFLAELEVAEDDSAIFLDDPVSSLDHRHRRHVARVLAEEAKRRQVVLLTHDIVFLLMLTKAARSGGVRTREMTMHRTFQHCGLVEDGPPWDAMPVERCVGALRKELQTAGAAFRMGERTNYEQKAEWIYKRLRQSWERAVEQRLLNQVVVRFGDGVATQRLKLLVDIQPEDVQLVETEMTYCSSFVHDESGAVNSGIPDPDVIEDDIQRLDKWLGELKKRGRT